MPNRLSKDEAVSKGNYAKFIAEPFEAGYGHTLGNSLRRVLLSSLEGAAISSIKLEGAVHEFGTLPGVTEDVTDIVLNLKKVLFKLPNRDPRVLFLNVTKEGPVTAGDIKLDAGVEVLNPDQIIATLDKKQRLEAELGSRWAAAMPARSTTSTRTNPSALSPLTRSSRRCAR